ncbi:PAS domain S-box protein [Undibacterium sp. TC9W]|uniref:PAS domain S-box protein n=1 Tax=Undibacterium sp. TC9W TaxID=3413053 RepID=UPI003BEF79CC
MKAISVERLTLIGFGIALLALLMIGGIAWNIAVPFDALKSIDHTRKVIDDLSELGVKLSEAENGQKAYFLTREESFLSQRNQRLNDMQVAIQHLRALTLDNAQQLTRIQQLQKAVDERASHMQESQKQFEALGFPGTRVLFNTGLLASAKIQNILADAILDEQVLLEDRKLNAAFRIKLVVGTVGFLLVFLLLWALQIRRANLGRLAGEQTSVKVREVLLKMGALQDAIFNSPNFSIIATDAQGLIQIFNVGAERMLGYDAADVVNLISPADISDSEELAAKAAALSAEFNTPVAPGFDALIFKAMRNLEDIYELTYIRRDGSRLQAIVSVAVLRDAHGVVIGCLLIGTDNTARKQVEAEQALLGQRLRDQQFYTRSLIEANIDALITTDLNGIISDVNHQMEEITGCTRDELIGAPFKNYFTEPAAAELAMKRALQTGKVSNFELTAIAKDGKETEVSYNASTIYDRERRLQGVFASARDVTEYKLFEQRLQNNNIELELAKAIAEKANLAKSEFLSSMSHELRTPLNAVLGFAQLMASDTPPPSENQKLSIDQILQAGWYLLRLINEILDLAMIESGKVSISKESILLSDVLLDCQAMIEPQAQTRGIKMIFPAMDIPLYVFADRTRLKQVMVNLLSNAIKYNQQEGSVTVEYVVRAESRIRISVRDVGKGLSPEQVGQLFQPFNRLGQDAGNEEGTGIGLVVTKQLVELMGGVIGVESNVGVGSVFWVDLSLASAPALHEDGLADIPNVQLIAQPSEGALPKRSLLYVEDNPANLALVEQLIARRSDLRLLTAVDAHLGIATAQSCKPDVILMDINLPGLSGFGALKILANDPLTAHIPVMALSANAMPRDIEKGLDAGFFRYLTKPIKVNEFMDALDLALHHAKEHGLSGKKVELESSRKRNEVELN